MSRLASIHTPLTVAALVGILVGAVRLGVQDVREVDHYAAQVLLLGDITAHDQAIHEEALRIRYGQRISFDRITRETQALTGLLPRLATSVEAEHPEAAAEIAASHRLRSEALEGFLSDAGVYGASLRGIPRLTHRIESRLYAEGLDDRARMVGNVVRLILLFDQQPIERLYGEVEQAMAALRDSAEDIAADRELGALLGHVRIVLDHRRSVEERAAQVHAAAVTPLATRLLHVVQADHNARNRLSRWLKLVFLGASGLLLWLLMRAFRRLREAERDLRVANTDLERRVRIRTDELELAVVAAEAANRTKSEFLANMSHELRTPLNSVIGFSRQLLKKRAEAMSPRDVTYIERIMDNGTHLLGLINDILDLSRIEANQLPLEKEPVELVELVEQTVATLQGEAGRQGVALTADLPRAARSIVADPRRLRQVLINLIGNALKFTSEGGVTVRLQVSADGVPARLSVIDTGCGIPADRLDAVFEAFQQADVSVTKTFGGTGLGLAISRQLAQAMDLDIVAESEVGVGSSFHILLENAVLAEETARGA